MTVKESTAQDNGGRSGPDRLPAVRLKHVRVKGFRSLKDIDLELGQVTILIGPNGAGKSGLLWALELVRLLAFGSLQLFVSERGGASYLMYYGPTRTAAIDIELEFATAAGANIYKARLGYGSDESLLFLTECVGYRGTGASEWRWEDLGIGHRESRLSQEGKLRGTAGAVRTLIRGLNFFHFHDTSRRSPLRTRSFNDTAANYLRSDGSNLPAFLMGLRDSPEQTDRAAWERIVDLVRRVAPFIRELSPQSDARGVSLDWIDDRGETFGPAHLSDGTLRAIALFSALAQPSRRMPIVSCIDEPELGLHPAALELLCSLVGSVAAHRQVVLSTQSPVVLDYFEPSSVVIAERVACATQFRRLDELALASWLEEYSLSEIYDKNVIGGRP
jgi:predicted ATPase